MKIDGVTVLIIIGAVALIIFASQRCTLRCNSAEGFGQDASIRASSGWLAGPKGIYGYDPIDQFAAQIEEMKARKRAERDGAFVVGLSESRNLVSSPTGAIGPESEMYREGHYPYILDRHCDHQSDCFEGEQCLSGVCSPDDVDTHRENYTHGEVQMPKCGACMSTEEFEMEE